MQHKFIFKLFNLRQLLVVASLIVFAILFVSCQKQVATSFETSANIQLIKEIPKDWQKIETDYFSFLIPPTMKNKNVRGIDSFVMKFENDEMTLLVESGDYTADIKAQLSNYEGQKESIIVDGKNIELISYDLNKSINLSNRTVNAARSSELEKAEKNYVFGIYVPDTYKTIQIENGSATSFDLSGKTIEAKEIAKIIFQSIKFKD